MRGRGSVSSQQKVRHKVETSEHLPFTGSTDILKVSSSKNFFLELTDTTMGVEVFIIGSVGLILS